MKTVLSIFLVLFSTSVLAVCDHLKYGSPSKADKKICRTGYALGYNYSRKTASWVAYRLTPEIVDGTVTRQNDFREDDSITKIYRATLDDYNEPVYELGHLAPSESLDLTVEMNSETFILSNMAPQLPGLNKAVWKGLENRERKWTKERDELFVYVGMLYEGEVEYLKGRIPIPTHFYKIMFSPSENKAIAYLFPHSDIKTKDLDKYLTSINEIEVRSGLNYLSKLQNGLEENIENGVESSQW